MEIERDFYTIAELAEHWHLKSKDIIYLGVTNRLRFHALAGRG